MSESVLEISLPLIKHYLRALGWVFYLDAHGGAWRHPNGLGDERAFPGGWSDDIDLLATSVFGERVSDVGFRLGICAIAENMIANVDAHHGRLSDTGASIVHEARRALASVDIPLHAWESARLPTIESGAKVEE